MNLGSVTDWQDGRWADFLAPGTRLRSSGCWDLLCLSAVQALVEVRGASCDLQVVRFGWPEGVPSSGRLRGASSYLTVTTVCH